MAAFQGQFLWVNHDANNLKAQPHQYRVFSHVQSQYRRWSRRKANEQLNASVRLPRVNSPNQHKRRRLEEPVPSQAAATEDASSLREHSQQPPPVKWQGNSDPFASFAVHVGPRVNQLIAFERDVLHPALHGRWALRTTEWDYCSACWSWLLPYLKSSPSGCKGFLATIASILSKCVCNESEYLHLSLVYKHQAMKLLQSEVAQSTVQPNPAAPSSRHPWYHRPGEPDLLAIFTLLLCEMFNENYTAATAHLTMLRSLIASPVPVKLDEPSTSPSMLHNLYSRIIFQDIQRAASTLTPTILPMSSNWWTSIGMGVAVKPTTIPPQPLPPDPRNIPPGTALHLLFSDIRELSLQLAYALSPTALTPSPATSSVSSRRSSATASPAASTSATTSTPTSSSSLTPSDYFYVWNYGIILSGRCINHALTCRPQSKWRDVYASLAMVYFIRLMSSREGILVVPGSGVRFNSAAKGLLDMMREALEMEVEAEEQNEERRESEGLELRLWALYVGSLSGEEEWFMRGLKLLAEKMGVKTWEKAEAIFKGFSVHGHSKEAWERAVGMERKEIE